MASRKGYRYGFNTTLDSLSYFEQVQAKAAQKGVKNPFRVGDKVFPTDAYGKRLKSSGEPIDVGTIKTMAQGQYGAWYLGLEMSRDGRAYGVWYPRGVKHEKLTTQQLTIRNILRDNMARLNKNNIVELEQPATMAGEQAA